MSVEYQILNPSGNITALVTNDYPREKYQEISSKIMQSNSKIEQVGFLKNIQIQYIVSKCPALNFVATPQAHLHVF